MGAMEWSLAVRGTPRPMSSRQDDLAPDPRVHRPPEHPHPALGAVYILLILFLGSWLGQFFAQLSDFRGEQSAHQRHKPMSIGHDPVRSARCA